MVRVNSRRLVAVLALAVLSVAFALGFTYHIHVNARASEPEDYISDYLMREYGVMSFDELYNKFLSQYGYASWASANYSGLGVPNAIPLSSITDFITSPYLASRTPQPISRNAPYALATSTPTEPPTYLLAIPSITAVSILVVAYGRGRKWFKHLLVASSLIAVFALGFHLGTATAQTVQIYITPQSFTSEASYIIFKGSDGKAYVKNGLTGQIEYSSNGDADVLQYAINVSKNGDKIVVVSDLDFAGKRITIDGKVLFIDFSMHTVRNGGITIKNLPVYNSAGMIANLVMDHPLSPAIDRIDVRNHVLFNVVLIEPGIGIRERAETTWTYGNTAIAVRMFGVHGVGVLISGNGHQANLMWYYLLDIWGDGTTNPIGIKSENSGANVYNDMSQFFGVHLENLGTGIYYDKTRNWEFHSVWFENNKNYDVDIQDGYGFKLFGSIFVPNINNPNNRTVTIIQQDYISAYVLAGTLAPSGTKNDNNVWFGGTTDAIINIPSRSYALRIWFRGSNDGELHISADANKNINLLNPSNMNIYVQNIQIPTSPPPNPVAGSMYFDPSTNKLYIYNGSTWVSVQLS